MYMYIYIYMYVCVCGLPEIVRANGDGGREREKHQAYGRVKIGIKHQKRWYHI